MVIIDFFIMLKLDPDPFIWRGIRILSPDCSNLHDHGFAKLALQNQASKTLWF